MEGLLIAAHGSRRQGSNDEVRRLAERVRTEAAGRYGWVECGFLELAEPDLVTAVDCAVDAGVTALTVVPYLLAAGRHVQQDIPAQLDCARRNHPDLPIRVAPHLGAANTLHNLVLSVAEQQ